MKSFLILFARFLITLFPLVLVSCDEEEDYDTPQKLRVIAARADAPFAKPGTNVQLEMLFWDASPRATRSDGTKRSVQTIWMHGCTNPPGDNFLLCVPQLHRLLDRLGDQALTSRQLPADMPEGLVGWEPTFTGSVASDAISSRPAAAGVVYPYGVEVFFFAVCGGQFRRLPVGESAFPLGCFDPATGEQLSRDDFDFGYFPVFAYEAIDNHNPEVRSIQLDGAHAGSECSDQTPCPPTLHCGAAGVCIPAVPRCTEDDRTTCPGYRVLIDVPDSAAEIAATAHVSATDAQHESVWVVYYSSAGSWEQKGRTIHDPSLGWSNDSSGAWRAGATGRSEARLWAVVRDNRNGVSWRWLDVWID